MNSSLVFQIQKAQKINLHAQFQITALVNNNHTQFVSYNILYIIFFTIKWTIRKHLITKTHNLFSAEYTHCKCIDYEFL